MQDGERMVPLAAIIGAHGVNGEVRLKLFGDGPESLKLYECLWAGARKLSLKAVRPGPNGAVARFTEIGDRNAAEALRGTQLSVPRSALPPLGEGEYYHFDLIGLACLSEAGEPIGVVVDISNFGAGDVLEIEKPDGKRFMIPMRIEAVPEWSTQRLVVSDAFLEN